MLVRKNYILLLFYLYLNSCLESGYVGFDLVGGKCIEWLCIFFFVTRLEAVCKSFLPLCKERKKGDEWGPYDGVPFHMGQLAATTGICGRHMGGGDRDRGPIVVK